MSYIYKNIFIKIRIINIKSIIERYDIHKIYIIIIFIKNNIKNIHKIFWKVNSRCQNRCNSCICLNNRYKNKIFIKLELIQHLH